jgi:hypothetical protein
MGMSQTLTSKYQVRIFSPAHNYSPASWNCRRDGRPTDANLARYVESFEASTRPGGVNAHLGETRILRAVIAVNEYGGDVVARYSAPLFTVIS